MFVSNKARMHRLFKSGRCLDVAIDHGVCNEPSFLDGLEDMDAVVSKLVDANPRWSCVSIWVIPITLRSTE